MALWCGLGSSAPLLYRGLVLNISQSVLLGPGDWRSFCGVGVLSNVAGDGVVSRWLYQGHRNSKAMKTLMKEIMWFLTIMGMKLRSSFPIAVRTRNEPASKGS